jgi:aspartate/methionine/tyrosine aminotransferase
MDHFLANAAYRIDGEPRFKGLERTEKLEQQGENFIHFEIGDQYFSTPRHILEAAHSPMKKEVLRFGISDMITGTNITYENHYI